MISRTHRFLLVALGSLLLLSCATLSVQAQVIRRKDAPIQAPPAPTVPPGGGQEQRQPDLAVTGPGSRPASHQLLLRADPCALITADEVEEIMKVPNNRALVTADKPRWLKEPDWAKDSSLLLCSYDLKFVNPLYPPDADDPYPERAHLDAVFFSIHFNDEYAKQGHLIIDPKEKEVLEVVNGLGDEALFLVDMTERERENRMAHYGAADRPLFDPSVQTVDRLYVRKGDLRLRFSVAQWRADNREKIIRVARKVLERMP